MKKNHKKLNLNRRNFLASTASIAGLAATGFHGLDGLCICGHDLSPAVAYHGLDGCQSRQSRRRPHIFKQNVSHICHSYRKCEILPRLASL